MIAHRRVNIRASRLQAGDEITYDYCRLFRRHIKPHGCRATSREKPAWSGPQCVPERSKEAVELKLAQGAAARCPPITSAVAPPRRAAVTVRMASPLLGENKSREDLECGALPLFGLAATACSPSRSAQP